MGGDPAAPSRVQWRGLCGTLGVCPPSLQVPAGLRHTEHQRGWCGKCRYVQEGQALTKMPLARSLLRRLGLCAFGTPEESRRLLGGGGPTAPISFLKLTVRAMAAGPCAQPYSCHVPGLPARRHPPTQPCTGHICCSSHARAPPPLLSPWKPRGGRVSH